MNDSLKSSEYKQMYLGKFIVKCAVHDNKKQQCPNEPVHYVEYRGEKVGLCERCFLRFKNGEFEQERVKRINREDRLYIVCPYCGMNIHKSDHFCCGFGRSLSHRIGR